MNFVHSGKFAKMTRYLLLIALCIATSIHAQEKITEVGLNLEKVEYPFPVSYIPLKIQREQLQMAYMDVKPDNPNGKSIMLLHGKNFNGAYWEQTAKDLAKNGFRVIIPDQIGFGKSSKPQHFQYTFQQLAENTKALLDTLNIQKITVLGHSMGGMLATRFTLMYPQTVEKLVLENPIGLEDWKTKVPYQSIDDWFQTESRQDYKKIKAYQMKNYYDNQWKPEYDRWAKMQAGWTVGKDAGKIAWTSALTYDMIFTQPVCYEFDQIKAPTLLIIGQRDRTALGKDKAPKEVQETLGNYPELGKKTAALIKNSKLAELDNVGHLPHIEDYPRFIVALTDFLK